MLQLPLPVLALMALSASSAFSAEHVVLGKTPSGGQAIAAKTDSHGTIHLLLNSHDGPQYVASRDDGQTFSKPIAVLDQAARKPGLEYTVWDVAVDLEGRVHVALGTNAWKLKLPKEEWGFFYARLDLDSRAFTPVTNLNRKPSEGFSLAADEKGNVTACWLADKMYANVSHDHGKTFGPTVEIDSSFDPCDCCTTSITYGSDGKLAILYREQTNNDRDMFLVLWDQAARKVSRAPISTIPWKVDACPMTYYSVVPDGDGYLTVFPTKGQIYFARLDSQGKLQTPVEAKTPGQTGMRTGMVALRDQRGHVLVTWKKDNHLSWQLYTKQGEPAGKMGTAPSAGSGAAAVLAKNGHFVLFP